MLSWLRTLLFLSGAAAIAGFLSGMKGIHLHEYIRLGYVRNAAALILHSIDKYVLAGIYFWGVLLLLSLFFGRILRGRVAHPVALSLVTVVSATGWARVGYPINRYGFRASWQETADFFGAKIPKALLDGEIWKTNLSVTAGFLLLGTALYFLIRFLLRRDWVHRAGSLLRPILLPVGAAGVLVFASTHIAGSLLFRITPTGPNVILISLDTLRADRLGCYGYPTPTSPDIDRIAAEGILFENAYSQAPWTLPSHTSMLTSRYPTVNQATRKEGLVGGKLPKWRVLCAEIFREAGYRTGGIVDGMFLTDRYGLEQGYDDFVAWGHRARNIVPRSIRWLERHGDEPFFLFLHIFDIHLPYALDPGYQEIFLEGGHDGDLVPGRSIHAQLRERKKNSGGGLGVDDEDARFLTALYNGGIRYTGDILAHLFRHLEESGLDESTVLVILSDHGEEFLEHKTLQHGALYRTVTHVPLIFRLPGGEGGGRRVPNTVGLIDVVPTLLDLTGLESPVPMSGSSLVPLMRGETDRFRRFLFSENRGTGGQVALIDDDYHLIGRLSKGTWEMFRHSEDPLEQVNLFDSEKERADSLRSAYMAIEEMLQAEIAAESSRGKKGEPSLDSRTFEVLKAMGYLEE